MIEVLKTNYWSKSAAFLLPLVGLTKSQKYNIQSYLFWDEYSIHNYQLIISISYDNYEEFLKYCRKIIFPILDKKGYILESYNTKKNETIFVLDMSEWALDIEMFLKGKYSKFSKEAKEIITEFHTFYDNGPKIGIHIKIALNPLDKQKLLNNLSGLDYVSEHYGLNPEELKKIGELASIYNDELETLVIKEYSLP